MGGGPRGDDPATAEGVSGLQQHASHRGTGAGACPPPDVPAHEVAHLHPGRGRPGSLQREDRIYLTYFAGGLRVIDISDPLRPREIAWHVPEIGGRGPQSNDVFVDADGLIYLVDRFDGHLEILEHHGV